MLVLKLRLKSQRTATAQRSLRRGPSTWSPARQCGTSRSELSDDGEVGVELLVDHEAEDAQHGRAAVVELDGALDELGLLVELVPAEVDGAVAEVPRELAGRGAVGRVLHHAELEEAAERDDLPESGVGDGVGTDDGRDAVREGVERVALRVDAATEVDPRAGGDLAEEGEHADAAVLELDEAEAVEPLLIGVVEHAERVVEAERVLGAELALEGGEGRGRPGRGGRDEGGGGADEGGGDDGLHGCGMIIIV